VEGSIGYEAEAPVPVDTSGNEQTRKEKLINEKQ